MKRLRVFRCLAPRCRERGRHTDVCGWDGRGPWEGPGTECVGCLPREAAAGLKLCGRHADSIAANARRAAEIYFELAVQLAPSGTGGTGDMVSGTRDRGLKLNPRAVESRTSIVDVLTSWCSMVASERAVRPPRPEVEAMAAFLATHSEWLAAHDAAGDAVDELHILAYGEPWAVAFPTGRRVIRLCQCPRRGCDGWLRAIMRRPDSLRPSEVVCSANDQHQWDPHLWLPLREELDVAGVEAGTDAWETIE